MLIDILFSIVLLGLWSAVLITDLRTRRIPIVILLLLTISALLNHAWLWWILIAMTLAWPPARRRSVVMLMPLAIGLGVATDATAAGLAVSLGVFAWAFNWWGGADSIALFALGLRYDWPGLIASGITCLIVGLILMLRRRRKLSGLWPVLAEAAALEPRVTESIPAEAELPAAAALAVVGLAFEIGRLISIGG
jgi:Flp pilus assembly protein protease CpaA